MTAAAFHRNEFANGFTVHSLCRAIRLGCVSPLTWGCKELSSQSPPDSNHADLSLRISRRTRRVRTGRLLLHQRRLRTPTNRARHGRDSITRPKPVAHYEHGRTDQNRRRFGFPGRNGWTQKQLRTRRGHSRSKFVEGIDEVWLPPRDSNPDNLLQRQVS